MGVNVVNGHAMIGAIIGRNPVWAMSSSPCQRCLPARDVLTSKIPSVCS